MNQQPKSHQQAINERKLHIRGFTILELLVVIAIAAVLAGLAIPRMQDMVRNNQVSGQNNELIALIHLGRNEAIRRNPGAGETVRVELIPDGAGWEGYVRPPGDAETADGCPVGAIRCSEHERVRLMAEDEDAFLIRFDNRGYSVDDAGNPVRIVLFLVHEDCRNELQARIVRVFPSGQVDSDSADCSPL